MLAGFDSSLNPIATSQRDGEEGVESADDERCRLKTRRTGARGRDADATDSHAVCPPPPGVARKDRPIHSAARGKEMGSQETGQITGTKDKDYNRSEERRVGKECRSRWSSDEERKK